MRELVFRRVWEQLTFLEGVQSDEQVQELLKMSDDDLLEKFEELSRDILRITDQL